MKRALSVNSILLNQLDEYKEWINTWKIFNKDGKDITKTFNCRKGWIQMIVAIKLLVNRVLDEDFHSLLTRNICQDPLQNFFGKIRSRGGSNDRPTCNIFMMAFKQLFCDSVMTAPTTGNCDDDGEESLLQYDSVFKRISVASNEEEPQQLDDADPMYVKRLVKKSKHAIPNREVAFIEENAMCYVAGRIVNKLKKRHPNCSSCHEDLVSGIGFNSSSHFTQKKNYFGEEQLMSNTTGLFLPGDNFKHHCNSCNAIFEDYFPKHYWENSIGSKLIALCLLVDDFVFCSDATKLFFTGFFVRLKLYSTLRKWNRSYDVDKRITLRKKKKVLHK